MQSTINRICKCSHPYCTANHGQYIGGSMNDLKDLKDPINKELLKSEQKDQTILPNETQKFDKITFTIEDLLLKSNQSEAIQELIEEVKLLRKETKELKKMQKNNFETLKDKISTQVIIQGNGVQEQKPQVFELGQKESALSYELGTKLMNMANEAKENAYCLYSNYHVGATLLTEKGNYFSGCNIENVSYGITNCAERTAIFNAIQNEGPEMKIKAIACWTQSEDGSPCGACRQVISEFSKDTTIIYFRGKGNTVRHYTMDQLLIHRFNVDNLKETMNKNASVKEDPESSFDYEDNEC